MFVPARHRHAAARRRESLQARETKAISGTIKPLSAERVAGSIVEGIEKERFAIIPDAQTKGLAKIAGVAPGVVFKVMDRAVRKSRGSR